MDIGALTSSMNVIGQQVHHHQAKTWQATLSTVCEEARKAEKPIGNPLPQLGQAAQVPADAAATPLIGGGEYVRHIVGLIRKVANAVDAIQFIVRRLALSRATLVTISAQHFTLRYFRTQISQ